MFGMSFVDLSIVAVLALLLLGPDQLPGAAKMIGKTLRDLRRASDDLKQTFEQEMVKLDAEVNKPAPRPPAPRSAVIDAARAVLPATALTSSESAPPAAASSPPSEGQSLLAAASVPLDQVRHAPPLDPSALRAQARGNAAPVDPGAARAAARQAALIARAPAATAPLAAAPAIVPAAPALVEVAPAASSALPAAPAPVAALEPGALPPPEEFQPLRTATSSAPVTAPTAAPAATIPRQRKPDPS